MEDGNDQITLEHGLAPKIRERLAELHKSTLVLAAEADKHARICAGLEEDVRGTGAEKWVSNAASCIRTSARASYDAERYIDEVLDADAVAGKG